MLFTTNSPASQLWLQLGGRSTISTEDDREGETSAAMRKSGCIEEAATITLAALTKSNFRLRTVELRMARDLGVQEVQEAAPHPAAAGGGAGEGQDCPPSPDRVEYSSSEEEVEEERRWGDEEVVEEEGEALYRQFLARRMEQEHLEYQLPQRTAERRQNYRREEGQGDREESRREGGLQYNEDLASLADRFSRSEGREEVRRRADQLHLHTVTQVQLELSYCHSGPCSGMD